MRYRADTSLKERILEVSRYLQVVHDDRWSQRPNILPVSMTFHDLPCPSGIFLQPSSYFYDLFQHRPVPRPLSLLYLQYSIASFTLVRVLEGDESNLHKNGRFLRVQGVI